MMNRLSKLCVATAAAALVGAPLAAAHAQSSKDTMAPSKYTLELYLAQYSFDAPAGGGRDGIGGFGARLMFGGGDVTKTLNTFFNRARAGVFATYTGTQKNYSTWHIGGQGDFPLFVAPMDGWLDPFVSLGAGVFHTKIEAAAFPGGTIPAGFSATENKFALTPAAGTLIPITGAIKFRGDLRDVIVFGSSTTNNLVAEGGLSVGF